MKLDAEVLIRVTERERTAILERTGTTEETVKHIMGLIDQTCDVSISRKRNLRGNRKPVYWLSLIHI